MTKFNKTSKRLSYFPITCHRFDTAKHPVVTSTARRAAKVRVMLSRTEKLMVEGLTNILQVDANEAIRIAVYEFHKAEKHPEVVNADRNNQHILLCPAAEKTDAVTIRSAIRWLAVTIRDTDVRSLTNSRRIGQEKLAKEWRKNKQTSGEENPGSTLKALHKAAESASQAAYDRAEEIYEERGEWMHTHPSECRIAFEIGGGVETIDILRNQEYLEHIEYDQMSYEEKLDYYVAMFNGDEELAKAVLDSEENPDD